MSDKETTGQEDTPMTREERVLAFMSQLGEAKPLNVGVLNGPLEVHSATSDLLRSMHTRLANMADKCYITASVTKSVSANSRHAGMRAFRAALMLEELGEVLEAMAATNELELAKELADLAYVVEGTAAQFRIPLEEAFSAVHESNMTKGKAALTKEDDRGHGDTYAEPCMRSALAKGRARLNAKEFGDA